MDDAKRLGLAIRVFAGAVSLGIAGDLLLRNSAFGVGFSIFALLVAAVSALLYRSRVLEISRGVRFLTIPTLGFCTLFFWRDAPELKLLNGVSVVLLVGLIAHRARNGSVRTGSVMDYPFRLIESWAGFVAGAVQVGKLEGRWGELTKGRSSKTIAAILRGLLLAVPLLIIFGGLFISADAGFEKMVTHLFQFSPEEAGVNFFVTVTCAWLAGGFLYQLFLGVDRPPSITGDPKPAPFGIVEIGTALALLNLLFAAFIATQFRHLFGGSEVIRNTANLGFGTYARRGFFELSAVALLVLPVLLGSHAMMRREGPKSERTYNVLASVLVALVFLVIHSAFLRMRIYVEAYGVSQLRIYVVASIAWIGAVFVWFATTVLRGRTDRFAFGALALLLATVFGLNVVNPDGLVARINTSRPNGAVDVSYLGSLSNDAVPELIKAKSKLPPDAQAKLMEFLGLQETENSGRDPRSFTLSSMFANAALTANHIPKVAPKPAEDEHY
ncbi:hypothetical protein OP10G_3857 [Fimbriimonas ginsengisoli Gsoil 348]|uniref:Uncharacterized protein n=2 Tax=Fimbriimonas ginsengisoli TaxID=1005039 RepID=A0A068NWS3_FIMGI|nr:hypothetical protein OP10G_3857 [Fimbriimonas ginsengisoli Gsoil 348]